MWNPALKLDFRLCTSIGILSGTVTGIDPHKPVVSLKIVNNTSKQIAFSIRCYRQFDDIQVTRGVSQKWVACDFPRSVLGG